MFKKVNIKKKNKQIKQKKKACIVIVVIMFIPAKNKVALIDVEISVVSPGVWKLFSYLIWVWMARNGRVVW